MDYVHKTVLLKESIEGLDIHPGETFLDGTLGSAGHSVYALEKTEGNLTLIGLDEDTEALKRSKERLEKIKTSKSNIHLENSNFRNLDIVLEKLRISKVDKILLDIGLSSDQFETSGRGFSFKKDEPLLMTFKSESNSLTAAYILNNWEEENIADIIYGYGEEKYARRIAKKIVEFREKKEIKTTFELVGIIEEAVPGFYRKGKIHPATRTFQALRITVNDELNALKDGLKKGFEKLNTKGRMAVISFHSLEDRLVKHFNKEKGEMGLARIITKRPITPSEEEIKENPRSRSAKLRILEKI